MKFVICIGNKNYLASLEFGKIYRAVPGDKAARHKMIRVINESGEVYLYSENSLAPIELLHIAKVISMTKSKQSRKKYSVLTD